MAQLHINHFYQNQNHVLAKYVDTQKFVSGSLSFFSSTDNLEKRIRSEAINVPMFWYSPILLSYMLLFRLATFYSTIMKLIAHFKFSAQKIPDWLKKTDSQYRPESSHEENVLLVIVLKKRKNSIYVKSDV